MSEVIGQKHHVPWANRSISLWGGFWGAAPVILSKYFWKSGGGGEDFPTGVGCGGGASSLLSIPSSAPHSWLHVPSTLASALVQSPGLLPWRLTLAVFGL